MKKSIISVFASVAIGAVLALAGGAGGTPCSPSFRNIVSTYEPFQVLHAAFTYHTGVSIPTNMRVVDVLATPGICKNNAERTTADISTTRSTSAGAITMQSANRDVPDLVHLWGTPVDQVQLPLNPTTVDVSFAYFFESSTASSRTSPLTMPLVPLQATTGHDTWFHDNSEGKYHHGSKSRQKPQLPPNQFLTRFYITLQYLADVITVDIVCAFLFGRWAQRYYQRIRKNRAHRRRRRSLRRWSRFASRMCLALRDALLLNRTASSTVHMDGGEVVPERPPAAEVDMMPPAGDSDGTSSLARGSSMGLVAQPTTEASLASKPSSTATGHEEGTAVCPPSPEVSGGTTGAFQGFGVGPRRCTMKFPRYVHVFWTGSGHHGTGPAIVDNTRPPPYSSGWGAVTTTVAEIVCEGCCQRGTLRTAGNAGDVTTQQASRQFIGWEDIGREAYYDHSDEALMANTYDVQDFETFERNGRIFIAGFCSGLGIENLPRSYMFGE